MQIDRVYPWPNEAKLVSDCWLLFVSTVVYFSRTLHNATHNTQGNSGYGYKAALRHTYEQLLEPGRVAFMSPSKYGNAQMKITVAATVPFLILCLIFV